MSFPPTFITSVVDWLRAGYPEGVPEHDFVPLLALLERRLSHEEVEQITDRLIGDGDLPITKADIAVLITKVTNEMPAERDINRVRAHLVEGGWPIAEVQQDTRNQRG